MTGAISPKRTPIWPPGSPNGRPNIPSSTGWVEVNIDQTLTFYRLPRQHQKHLKSTNMPTHLNEEIKGQTHVVPIFPNGESWLKLVRALAVKTHENWLEQHRYLNVVTRFRARRNTDPGVFANCPM